jgi:hypothetical protein
MAPSPGSVAAFAPLTLAADARLIQQLLAGFFAALPPEVDWNRPTERHGGGWTLHQTLAHITAVAESFHWLMEETLEGRYVTIPGLSTRSDLPTFNERQITAREHIAPARLQQTLLSTFDRLAHRCLHLTPRELLMRLDVPSYNSPLSVAELIGAQLIHAGLVHAAQLANGAGTQPLWVFYTPELMHRQLVRTFYMVPYIYWPERGGNLHATINYIVGGHGGGRWSLRVRPDGASIRTGSVRWARLTMWASNPRVICRVFTLQSSILEEISAGQAFAWGDIRLGMRLFSLFSAT